MENHTDQMADCNIAVLLPAFGRIIKKSIQSSITLEKGYIDRRMILQQCDNKPELINNKTINPNTSRRCITVDQCFHAIG